MIQTAGTAGSSTGSGLDSGVLTLMFKMASLTAVAREGPRGGGRRVPGNFSLIVGSMTWL